MQLDWTILRSGEQIMYRLRGLYERYGYRRFKMSKFEEYDLYVRNKDFLVSDRMITFTDARGILMALKPDVTLSIIKNTRAEEAGPRKVYYNESVYRSGQGEETFQEIMQTGLECIGELDLYHIYEVIALAGGEPEDHPSGLCAGCVPHGAGLRFYGGGWRDGSGVSRGDDRRPGQKPGGAGGLLPAPGPQRHGAGPAGAPGDHLRGPWRRCWRSWPPCAWEAKRPGRPGRSSTVSAAC